MTIRVEGYTRIDPTTGRVVRVSGYTRDGAAVGGGVAARKGTFIPSPRVSVPDVSPLDPEERAKSRTARFSALNIRKRRELRKFVGKGEEPSPDAEGWEEITVRRRGRSETRLQMTDREYEKWRARSLTLTRAAWDNEESTSIVHRVEVTTGIAAGSKVYTDERKDQQDAVIDKFLKDAEKVPREHKAVMTGGRPGAGKSTSLADQGITGDKYFVVDSDAIKEEMIKQGMAPEIPDLTPFESAGLIHHESTEIMDRLLAELSSVGTNIVVDGTMAWGPYVTDQAKDLAKAKYSVKGVFVHVTQETSQRRAAQRHRFGVEEFLKGNGVGGRFVDPRISRKATDNDTVFEQLKEYFDGWVAYDNDSDTDPPRKIASSHEVVEFSHHTYTVKSNIDLVNQYLVLSNTLKGGEVR